MNNKNTQKKPNWIVMGILIFLIVNAGEVFIMNSSNIRINFLVILTVLIGVGVLFFCYKVYFKRSFKSKK